MAEGRDDRIELMKKDKTELIRNIRRAKRKLVGSLDSIDALWPDEGSTDKREKDKRGTYKETDKTWDVHDGYLFSNIRRTTKFKTQGGENR